MYWCEEIKTDVQQVKNSIDTKCTIDDVKELINKDFRETMNTKCDKGEVKELIRGEMSEENISTNYENKVKEIISQSNVSERENIIMELEDRNSRKLNFLIFNAPEIESNLKNEIQANNLAIANSLLEACDVSENLPSEKVFRLGIKGTRNRPILVSLKDIENKRTLFKQFD